jgi:POT family proton-dependent oligopeptide transporter
MAHNHEDMAAELHATIQERTGSGSAGFGGRKTSVDATGGSLPIATEKSAAVDMEQQGVQTADGQEPTEAEKKSLRRLGDAFPKSAYLIAVVELCERFTYYGCQGLFQNYISNDAEGHDGARGLGLGHAGATGLNTFFRT